MVLTMNFPSLLNMKTGVSNPRNSRRYCLHIPHGLQKSSMSVETPMALKDPMRWPICTAVPMATRSAHVPTGYEAFSMLAPFTMCVEGYVVAEALGDGEMVECRSREAPTRNREYGPICTDQHTLNTSSSF